MSTSSSLARWTMMSAASCSVASIISPCTSIPAAASWSTAFWDYLSFPDVNVVFGGSNPECGAGADVGRDDVPAGDVRRCTGAQGRNRSLRRGRAVLSWATYPASLVPEPRSAVSDDTSSQVVQATVRAGGGQRALHRSPQRYPPRRRDQHRRPAAGHRGGQPRRRLRSESAFAMLVGVAPLPASSGRTHRHRLNRGGDRQADAALLPHRVLPAALGRTCPRLRRTPHRPGMSKKEIIRCLKRYIAREAYTALLNPDPTAKDQRRAD